MISECLPGICLNNGACTEVDNAYRCDCVPGFTGINCQNSTYCIFYTQDLFRMNKQQVFFNVLYSVLLLNIDFDPFL